MKLGFVGIGQGGSNIAAAFSDKFPVVCINTAKQDLENLPIPPDFKIFAKISEGGAGKDVRLGERAIEENREVIAQKIDLAMRDRDLVFVAAGLGGGTGSLGLLQILEILGEKGLNHSVIATFPMSSEGTNEKLNAVLAARQLHKALKESPSFRSIIFIDNNRLKSKVMEQEKFTYEKLWETANRQIKAMFDTLNTYTETAAFTAFDPEDLKNILLQKGCLVFGGADLDWDERCSETVLAAKVIDLWNDSIFLADPDVSKATGAAVLIERPANFDRDGQIIDRLYEEIKRALGSGMLCRGVYANDNMLTRAADAVSGKRIRAFTVIAGRKFPKQFIADLYDEAKAESESLKSKRQDDELGIDLGDIKALIGMGSPTESKREPTKKLDFSVFNDESEPLAWKIKGAGSDEG